MLGVVGLMITSGLNKTFSRLGLESRAAVASMELENVLQLLNTELRMGAAVSPYLPGNNPTTTVCGSQITVTPTTVRFLVSHDEDGVSSGRRIYYVGYSYDAATKTLYRGQIASTSTTTCTLPAGDPTSSSVAFPIATNVVTVDGDGNGTVDPVFAYSSGLLTFNLGLSIKYGSADPITQKFRSTISVRSV